MAIDEKEFKRKMEEVKSKLTQSVIVPQQLSRKDRMNFRCYPGIGCFTKCCSGIRINLTPYDIYRLKKRLGMSYHDFLLEYTVPRSIDGTPLPIVVLKLKDDEEKSCPFVTPGGCTVYSDRPVTCRYYPIGMAIMKKHDKKSGQDFFIKIKEDHCLGHSESKDWSIDEWRTDQESDLYDEMNEDWMEVVLKAKTLGFVEFGQKSLDLFFMVSSNLDMFRDFVFNSNFLEAYEIEPAVVEKIKGDELALLKFSLKWLRFTMFGEGDFKVKDEARQVAKERQKAAALEKARLAEQRAKKALAKKPEDVMKEADRDQN
ncbi:MAG: YkgJ family cysteine cluster protein [Nitrospiraceae bacterium]|nr:YkgJ family cysteine cluster protein [Nitrospiraceae bacterium]MDA8432914.1 YkgJ family cysteine cluster protein [Nitrospiraceae bacterium]